MDTALLIAMLLMIVCCVGKMIQQQMAPSGSAQKRYQTHTITVDESGFTVTPVKTASPTPVSMRWDEVHRVAAFKRDQFTVDLLCLFFFGSDDTGVEVHEDMEGWKKLIEKLPTHLAGCIPWSAWFSAVAFPAFETNLTDIYVKNEPESSTPCPTDPLNSARLA